jgi:hypothetical protein
MSNNYLPSVQSDDGWSDAATESAERVIRGALLKFTDWNWTKGKEAIKVEDGTSLVAIDTAAGWVKWAGGKPVEYRMRQPGRRLPERDEVGDLDQRYWEAGSDGRLRDPWQSTRFLYLVDPLSAEAYTFSTSSLGGRGAISDLAEQIERVRFARPGAVPVVELHAAPMQTKHGRKSRPFFKVVDWRGGGDTAVSESAASPMIENKDSTATERVFDDEIPF